MRPETHIFGFLLAVGSLCCLVTAVPAFTADSLTSQLGLMKGHYAYPFIKEFMRQKMRDVMMKMPPQVADILTNPDLAPKHQMIEKFGHLKDENDKPTPELIVDAGYPVEIHSATTEDGYILQMHRIPYGIAPGSGPGEGSKTPVYLQHCLLCSSAEWVIKGVTEPGQALAYILADAGYDVWMGNIRGNTYSKKHVSLTPEDSEFWQYSWDEHGKYDVPAQMDLISDITGYQEMFYIGHSMGTTMFFVMSSERPEHRDRIRAMFAMAPIARVDHMLSPLYLIAPFVDEIEWLLMFFGLDEFLPSDLGIGLIASLFCIPGGWGTAICNNVIFLLAGYDEAQMDDELLPYILGHTPAGTSTRTIVHYAQLINAGQFQHYDYGPAGNMEHYGQENPPEYNVAETVTSPIFTYWSDNDWLGQPEDVAWLTQQLPNLIEDHRVPLPEWNHMDFLWGIDADTLLYPDILEKLNALNTK